MNNNAAKVGAVLDTSVMRMKGRLMREIADIYDPPETAARAAERKPRYGSRKSKKTRTDSTSSPGAEGAFSGSGAPSAQKK